MGIDKTVPDSSVEIWAGSDSEEESNEPNEGTASQQGLTTPSLILLRFMVIFLLSWQALFCIPNIAIHFVLKFISILLHKLSDLVESNKLRLLAETFPTTMLKAHKFQGISHGNYQLLVVCRKCHSTYDYDTCLKSSVDQRNVATCSFVRYPRHPQARLQTPCGTPLLKKVKTSSRKTL